MYSRFTRANSYRVWIQYNEEYVSNAGNDIVDLNEPILGYYCTCKAGAKTLGTCALVACLLWYLKYTRHTENIKYTPLKVLRSILNADFDYQNIQIIDP